MSDKGILGLVIAGLGLLVTLVSEGITESVSSDLNVK
jgi:hypothetical protein